MRLNLINTLLMISILSSCTENNTLEKVSDNTVVNTTIEFKKLPKVPIEKRIKTTGTIDVPPSNRASVSVYYGGTVSQIDLLPGEKVKKGQLLFTLEDPAFISMQQAYLQAKEELKFLEADYNRQQALNNEQITSRKKLELASKLYKSTYSELKALEQKLKLLNINTQNLSANSILPSTKVYAPISGFVESVDISLGKHLIPGEAAMQIVNTEHIHLELLVFEKDALHMKEGQRILFRVPESSGKLYEGVVHVTGKAISDDNRTVNVHGHLEEEQEGFIPGMYVEAEIIVELDSGYVVPLESITQRGTATYVGIQGEGEAIKLEKVVLGHKFQNKVEIKFYTENIPMVYTGDLEEITD